MSSATSAQLPGSLKHPLLEQREIHTVGVLVVTSDRGLAGGYNSSVIRLAEHKVAEHQAAGRTVRLYTVGAKALAYFRYRKYQISHHWLAVTDTPTYADARSIANSRARRVRNRAPLTRLRRTPLSTYLRSRRPQRNGPFCRSHHLSRMMVKALRLQPVTSSSHRPRRSSAGCFRGTSRERCSACCLKHRRRNTLLVAVR